MHKRIGITIQKKQTNATVAQNKNKLRYGSKRGVWFFAIPVAHSSGIASAPFRTDLRYTAVKKIATLFSYSRIARPYYIPLQQSHFRSLLSCQKTKLRGSSPLHSAPRQRTAWHKATAARRCLRHASFTVPLHSAPLRHATPPASGVVRPPFTSYATFIFVLTFPSVCLFFLYGDSYAFVHFCCGELSYTFVHFAERVPN